MVNVFADNALGHILTKRIQPYLTKSGFKLYENPQGCDVQLSFVRAGWRGPIPVVLRLDGIYYSSIEPYKERNAAISSTHTIASGVIYQSNYSKSLCEALLSKRNPKAKTEVIYNGIEPMWCGAHEPDGDHVHISIWSKWRRHKRLLESIQLFLKYHDLIPNSTLHIFGLMHDNKPVVHDAIKYYGMVDRERMFEILRKTWFTLHLSKRDSSPNSVLEALSAGMPVITTNNTGGSVEMCNMTPGCIVVPGDGDYNDVSTVNYYGEPWNVLSPELAQNLLDAMLDMTYNKRRVLLPKELHASYTADKYMEVLYAVL